jgi:hypothetical protein
MLWCTWPKLSDKACLLHQLQCAHPPSKVFIKQYSVICYAGLLSYTKAPHTTTSA